MTVLAPSSQTIYHRAVRSTVCPSPPLQGFPGGLRLSGLKKTNVSQCNQVIDRDRFSALEMYFPCDSLNVLLHRGIPSARACFSVAILPYLPFDALFPLLAEPEETLYKCRAKSIVNQCNALIDLLKRQHTLPPGSRPDGDP